MVGIYGIFRKSDDKCVYVGESTNIDKRIKEHLRGHLHKIFNKDEYYGKILETHDIDDHHYRLQRESFWINKLNAELNQIRDGSCWNKGKTGIYTKESLNKMRNARIDTHHTNEAKEKIGAAKKGNKYNLGRHFINNGVINKFVKQEQFQDYLDKGWKRGRIKFR